MSLLGLFSIFFSAGRAIKEASQPTVPAENWGNKDLIYKDRMSGMSEEEILKNIKRGKYIIRETHPEPHRDRDGKIIIENSQLYYADVEKYGAHQAHQWVRQGKYNLTPEELEKETARCKEKTDRICERGY